MAAAAMTASDRVRPAGTKATQPSLRKAAVEDPAELDSVLTVQIPA